MDTKGRIIVTGRRKALATRQQRRSYAACCLRATYSVGEGDGLALAGLALVSMCGIVPIVQADLAGAAR